MPWAVPSIFILKGLGTESQCQHEEKKEAPGLAAMEYLGFDPTGPHVAMQPLFWLVWESRSQEAQPSLLWGILPRI